MKTYNLIKVLVYFTFGVLILIFNKLCLEHIPLIISIVMLLNATDDIVVWSKQGIIKEGTRFFNALVLIILAIILLIIHSEFEKCLIIFAVWMILKEGTEITHCIQRMIRQKPAILDLIESVFIIVMSILLIANPNEHHAYIHIFILGVELISELLFYFLYNYLDKKEEKNEIKDNVSE